MDFLNGGRAMRHGRVLGPVTQLEIAAAKKMVRLDGGRSSEGAAHDPDPPIRSSRLGARQFRFPVLHDFQNVFAVLRHDPEKIAAFEQRKIEFIPEFALFRFNEVKPVLHVAKLSCMKAFDPERPIQTGK
jgi:hypothetical protein